MTLSDTTLATRMAENLSGAAEWKVWIDAFDVYAIVLELEKKSSGVQLATIHHCLGPSVQIIFSTLPGEKSSLKAVLEEYFAPKRNVVAERYRFRSRQQHPNEAIDGSERVD